MSTVRLKRKARWDITSDILYHPESFAYHFRDYIEGMTCQWVKQGILFDDVPFGIVEFKRNCANVEHCLSPTTSKDSLPCNGQSKIVEKKEKRYLNDEVVLSCYAITQGNVLMDASHHLFVKEVRLS